MYNQRPPPIGVPSSINQLVDVLSSQSAQSVEVVRTLVNEFVEIIDMIMNDCSQVNIQNGKTWIMTNITTLSVLPPLLSFLLETSNNVSKFSQRLHLIYLMNDVLFHMDRLKFDWFKNGVNGWICKFVSNAVMMASNEEKGKIEKLLNIWSDKGYFPPETIQNLRSSIAKPSLPIPSHSMPPSGAMPRSHPSAPYAPPPNFPPFPPPPMHPPPLHPPIPLHHPPHHTARPPMLPPQIGAIPPPGLFPPPPPHTGQLPMPPMPIIPPVPIPGVNPPKPKQYHELPAGLMVPLVKPTSKPYTPIPTALIQLPSTRPNPTDELLSALDQFYEKIDVKLSKHGKNNVDDEKQTKKKGDKKKGSNGVGDKENEGEVIDKYGFQVGFLDEWRKERAALKRQMERDRYEESRSSRDGRDRQSRSRGGRYHDDSDSESDSDSDRGSKKRSSRGRKRSKSRSRDNRRRRSVSSESSYSSRSRSSRSRSYSSSRSRSRSRSRSKPKSRSNKRYRSSSRSSYSSDSSYRHSKSRSRRIRRDRSPSRSRSRSRSLPRTGLGSGTGSSTADKAMIGYKLLQKSGWNPSAGSSSSKLGSLIESSAPRTMDTKYHGIGVGHSNNNNNEQSADVFDHFRKAKSYTFNRYTSDPNRVRTADTCFRCGQPGHFAKNCQSGLY